MLIDEIEALPKLYGRIFHFALRPDEVHNPRAPEGVRSWIAQSPVWLETTPPSARPDFALGSADLGRGDRNAILLPQELDADELVIDDIGGRREAQRRPFTLPGRLVTFGLQRNQGYSI